MTDPQKPKRAATVILLRPLPPTGFEVFLIRRPEGMAFLGGMHCFPGGAVTKDDYSAAMLECCRGLTEDQARKIIGAHFTPQEALGFWVGGIRELFEETGILLAVEKPGARMALKAEQDSSLIHQRTALLAKSLSFQSLLANEELFCDLASLAYFSQWQTPSHVPIRFDTRFFLAALPDNQSPLPTSPEVAHSLWLTPDRALKLFAKNELPMIFPTFAALRTLADFDSLERVRKEFQVGPVL
jgi:8-oxo-dGTP pyrophosphatase MutT (NUDIX family)